MDRSDVMRIKLNIQHTVTNVTEELIAYAEVWATPIAGGEMLPVAWIGGVTDVEGSASSAHLPLYLSLQWLSLANATAPLELRNVLVQNQLIPVAQTAGPIPVTSSAGSRLMRLVLPMRPSSINRVMREGHPPAQRVGTGAGGSKLLLSHGYCAQVHPFAEPQQQFAESILFMDLEQSRTNDEFAQKIAQFAAALDLQSFGLVAHSQGGLASVHLHAYYFSNLELATGARLIQSVGSPYQGSALAGSISDLGNVFGVGCGANFDLTHDGAALWLRGITSTHVLADVFYYTTQYQTGGLINSCNIASNLVLSWPNDGVTEKDYSTLQGGNFQAHTKGQCHTVNMNWLPQCWDATRNAVLSTQAAR